MARMILTTSWDDGHVDDLRVAEMLSRHGLTGTFYVPRASFLPVMADAKVRELAGVHEVGAHTMTHPDLTRCDDREAQRQILDSRAWVSDVTGRGCEVFCPPWGRFLTRDRLLIAQVGYAGFRTVEGWSVARPQRHPGLYEMRTTLQAFPHGLRAPLFNLTKRRAVGALWRFVRFGRGTWVDQARRLLDHCSTHGGVFHLWGHGWEVNQANLWDDLDRVLTMMASYLPQAQAMTNGELCHAWTPKRRVPAAATVAPAAG